MKKIHFGVIKIQKWFVNSFICFILVVLSSVAIIAGLNYEIPASTVSGVYYNGNRNSNNVSLMINVYWGTEYLDEILSILETNNIKTTFFIGGTWAVINENFLLKIYKNGHELANHGFHHKEYDKLEEKGVVEEIKTTHKIVNELTGFNMNLFAPPSGAYNKTTVSAANLLGYRTVMWTRDTIDWRDHDSNLIYNRAVKNAHSGDLILMHPTKQTVEALPKIIDFFKKNNLKLTTVSNTIDY